MSVGAMVSIDGTLGNPSLESLTENKKKGGAMNHHGGCNDNMSKSQYGIERLERGKIGNGCGNILKFYHQYIHSSYYSNVEKSYCAEATLLNSLQKLCKNGPVVVIIPYIIGVGKS